MGVGAEVREFVGVEGRESQVETLVHEYVIC